MLVMRYLSLQTVAARTETSVGFWRRQIRLGNLCAARAGRRVLLSEETVEEYLSRRTA